MISLNIDTKTSGIKKEKFIKEAPDFSIALDGYVYGKYFFIPSRKLVNFNHHEEVDRLSTRCTSAQVLMAIRMGLFDTFTKDGEDFANLFVNDCDEDVCTAVFLLRNKNLVINSINPLINKLVHVEDMLDTTCASYPFPHDLDALSEMAWVFQPYRMFRTNGGLNIKNPSDYECVINDVGYRIMQYVTGHGQKIKINGEYEVLYKSNKFTMIKENSSLGRLKAFADGIKAYVIVSDRPDGNYNYVLGRISEFIDFDLEFYTKELNKLEKCPPEDSYGGGNLIIGSPRYSGSPTSPEKLNEFLNNTVSDKVII